MSLDLKRLENVVDHVSKWTARCPVCAACERDRKGDNLVVFRAEDGETQGAYWCIARCDTKEIFNKAGVLAQGKLPPRKKIRHPLTGKFGYRRYVQPFNWGSVRVLHARATAADARDSLPEILRDHAWSAEQVAKDSAPLPNTPGDHFQTWLRCWEPDDVIFCGPKFAERGKYRFYQTAREWSREWPDEAPWRKDDYAHDGVQTFDHTFGWSFQPDSNSRDRSNFLKRRFVIFEADNLDFRSQLAVIHYLATELEMPLAYILHAAGKSLHAAFDATACDHRMRTLELQLCGIACEPSEIHPSSVYGGLGGDPQSFSSSGTRVPGCRRNPDAKNNSQGLQRLVYLAPDALRWS